MNLFNGYLAMNWMRRPARFMRPTLFLMVLILIAGAASSGFAQQNRTEVCRETRKVAEQLARELREAAMIRDFILNKDMFRSILSALNKGISNGRVELTGVHIPFLMTTLRVEDPGAATKDRLAFQKTVRPLVQKAIQVGSSNNLGDVELQIARLDEQFVLRRNRLRDLNCDQISTDESSAAEMVSLGCFKDSNNPFDLDGFLERSSSNTPESCVAKCKAKGFAFAGVQYGQSCLCGNSYGKQGKSSNCTMKCTGDGSKICGGLYCNSVYGTGAVPK